MKPISHRFVTVIAVATTTLAAAASPAAAVPPGDAHVDVLAAAGSDTTQDVMGAVLAAYRGDPAVNPDGDITVNIPVKPTEPLTVPGDDTCGERAWVTAGQDNPPTTFPAPSGSGAGKAALADSANLTTACIDIARSSAGRGGSDPATFEYYGYAKDAVSWAHYAGAAPAGLTLQQLRGIYACTITNWSEVGGQDTAIVRYLPPAGSGTRSFFVGTVLGAEPSTACGAVQIAAENDGSAVPAEDLATAILPFSAAQWVAQANTASPDIRAGVQIGALNDQNPVAGPDAAGKYAPNVAVINGGFPGVRTVYNVLDTRLPSYAQALRVAGFDADGPGYLCSGSPAVTATLTTYGFTPLTTNTTGNACTKS
jgi:phosphate transport system substrate-binding protein